MNWSWYVWLFAIALGGAAGYGFFRLMRMKGSVVFYIIVGAVGSVVGMGLRGLIGLIINSWFSGILFGLLGAAIVILTIHARNKKHP